MGTPQGHVRRRPFGYETSRPEGRDLITKRYRCEYAHSEEEAELASILAACSPRAIPAI
jgi:hypothetical protein